MNDERQDDIADGSIPEDWKKPASARARTTARNKTPAQPLKPHERTLAILLVAIVVIVLDSVLGGSDWIIYGALGAVCYQLLWDLIYSAVKAARDDADKK